jgi:hypothetical protein
MKLTLAIMLLQICFITYLLIQILNELKNK